MTDQLSLFSSEESALKIEEATSASVLTQQLALFCSDNVVRTIPERTGKASVNTLEKAQLLTPASGFMSAYDFTLNPYVGCQFGCAYCYAAFFVNSAERRENWGLWVDVKVNAEKELAKKRTLFGKKIYMSSVTDPYQPLEAKIGLTRSLLEFMSEPERQTRMVIQTRSPLVSRDIDILRRYKYLRVNMTVTTDSDEIRKRFEPSCPSNDRRLEALEEIKAAGIKICICITPMLPLEDPERFAKKLSAMNADIYVAQPFKPSQGRFAAGTRSMALEIAEEYKWTEDNYRNAFCILRKYLPQLYEGQEGFMPE